MKIFLVLLILISSPKYTWIEALKEDISNIEENGEIISKEEKIVDETLIKITKFEINKQNAVRLDFFVDEDYSISQTIYRNKKMIYADICRFTFPILYQGKKQPEDPDASIHESSCYFKNKNEGVEFSRSVSFANGQNLDSLKRALENLPYEIKVLDNSDYQRSVEAYKRKLKDF